MKIVGRFGATQRRLMVHSLAPVYLFRPFSDIYERPDAEFIPKVRHNKDNRNHCKQKENRDKNHKKDKLPLHW